MIKLRQFKTFSMAYAGYSILLILLMINTSIEYEGMGYIGYSLCDYIEFALYLIGCYIVILALVGIYNNIVYRLRGGRYGK